MSTSNQDQELAVMFIQNLKNITPISFSNSQLSVSQGINLLQELGQLEY